MNLTMRDIIRGVQSCVLGLAQVKETENVLVFTDTSIDPVVPQTFAAVAGAAGARAIIMTLTAEMSEAAEVGGEIPAHVVEAIKGADVIFGVTSYPLQHTPAIRPLVAHTVDPTVSNRRWVNVPPPHDVSLSCKGATDVPGKLVTEIVARTIAKMQKGLNFRMTSENGTDITTEQDPKMYSGSLKYPLPPGRFQVFPFGVMNPGGYVHEKGNGVLVVDAVDHFYGLLRKPIAYHIVNGYVERVEGGPEAQWVEQQMVEVGREYSRPWWEFSIGANPCIPIYRNNYRGLEAHWHAFAHRTAGVVHIALGIDPYFHLHGSILEPTIVCLETGETIVKKGWLTMLDDPEISSELKKCNIVPSRW